MSSNKNGFASFEVIPEESSRINSQSHILDIAQEEYPYQLLLRAYQRIKELQVQNQSLQKYTNQQQNNLVTTQLYREIERLNQQLSLKEAQIHKLQKISEKLMINYLKIEQEYQRSRKDSMKMLKTRFIAANGQQKSPLNSIFISQKDEFSLGTSPKAPSNKENLYAQVKFQLINAQNSHKKKFEVDYSDIDCSRKIDKKNLKNSFQSCEMNNLINKVHIRHDSALNCEKNKVMNYKNYCLSMQKKYSPRVAITKRLVQSYKNDNFARIGQKLKPQLHKSASIKQKFLNANFASTSKSGDFYQYQ